MNPKCRGTCGSHVDHQVEEDTSCWGRGGQGEGWEGGGETCLKCVSGWSRLKGTREGKEHVQTQVDGR
jgi:hypothetical protein